MDPNALLAQLRDVQAPPDISWWPPAPGWWLLACIMVSVGVWGVLRVVHWRKKTAWRREALQALKNIQAAWSANHDPKALTEIIVVIKRALASAQQTPSVMSSSGDAWRETLRNTEAKLDAEDIALFSDRQYQKDVPVLDQEVFRKAERILKGVRAE